jgi:hypothetical protein
MHLQKHLVDCKLQQTELRVQYSEVLSIVWHSDTTLCLRNRTTHCTMYSLERRRSRNDWLGKPLIVKEERKEEVAY